MICPKCGNEINDDSVFCPKCGERIQDKPSTNVDKAIELTESEIAKRNKTTLACLIVLLSVGFLLFLLGFLLLGLSIWTIILLIIWVITFIITFTSFKKLPVTQKEADEHDEKVRAKFAPNPAPKTHIYGDLTKAPGTVKYSLWVTKFKGFKKFFVIFALAAGLAFGIFGGLLPITGVGGFANVPNGIYVQDQSYNQNGIEQVGVSAFKFENSVLFYTANYTGDGTSWGKARTYHYKAGRVTYSYSAKWAGESGYTNETVTLWVTNFGNTLSENFFGLGGPTYSKV